MNIQIGKLHNSKPALVALIGMKLPIVTAFKVGVIAKQIEPHLDVFEASRLKLCEEYGTLNEETGNYDFGENKQIVEAEYQKLGETEIEVNFPLLSITDFNEDCQIAPGILIPLDWLIDLGA